jgi:hypothetical protein
VPNINELVHFRICWICDKRIAVSNPAISIQAAKLLSSRLLFLQNGNTKNFVSEWHRDHSLLLVLSIHHCRTFFMHCVNEFLDEDWAFVSTEAFTKIGD